MSIRHQHRTMNVISDKLRCPSDTKTEQCLSYRTSYDVLQTPTHNNACSIGQATLSFRYQHITVPILSENYDVLQILTQNNACHIGQATLSFRYQNSTMLFISDKLRCPSDTNIEQCMYYRKKVRCPSHTNTEQCMSFRTSYDILLTLTQNYAYHIGKAKMSFRHYHRTMHVISEEVALSFRYQQ